VKVSRQSNSSIEVTLNIEMDETDEDPFLDRSYRRTVNQIRVPGFRPGKAPRSIVENYVGRTALVHEALDFMIPETLDQVLRDEDLQAFGQPDVEVLEMEPVSFKAVVPLEPLVELGDFRSIRVEREEVEVTDEAVGDVMERLRQESAPWEPVERPVQFGDMLNVDVKGSIDGEQVVDDQGIDYLPQEENVLPFPGFAVHLEGMSEGEEKEFVVTIPEDYPREQYAGKDCNFQVKVLSIKDKMLPDLDDEFAKGVGEGYDDLEALRNFVRERLTEEEEARVNHEFQENSLDELIKIASVHASQMLFQREVDAVWEERERALRSQRLDMETYLRFIGQTEDEFRDSLLPGAQERLTRFLVMRKLAQEEEIEVTDEEAQEELDALFDESGENAAAMRRALSTESARENMRTSLLNRKVMERLTQIAQGTAAAESTEEQAEAAAEASAPEGADGAESQPPEDSTPEADDQREDSTPEADDQREEGA
jgi:trigger factor